MSIGFFIFELSVSFCYESS